MRPLFTWEDPWDGLREPGDWHFGFTLNVGRSSYDTAVFDKGWYATFEVVLFTRVIMIGLEGGH